YLFSDYCSGVISGLQIVGGDAVSVVDLGLRAPGAVAFGTDPNGDVLVALLGGGVRRIIDN
ncbi:MAG: hypothetical protein KDB16_18090, partial [Acidimicrobiales bacterium]|nr:hypothetical protein [Acidimicrobiales bacterium]